MKFSLHKLNYGDFKKLILKGEDRYAPTSLYPHGVIDRFIDDEGYFGINHVIKNVGPIEACILTRSLNQEEDYYLKEIFTYCKN